MNPKKIRRDFPVLSRKVHGKPLVYLDNASTTQKPRQVIEAMTDFYENHCANVHRGKHALSEEASELYEQSHAGVGGFVNARFEETVFTRNTTEAINLLAYSFASQKKLRKGDTVLVSGLEHHANLVPWILLKERIGIRLEKIPLTSGFEIDSDAFSELLEKKPKVVSVSACSNVLGTITPIREIVRRSHEAGSMVIVDGAQAVPHFPVDFKKLDADFLAFSGHKMLGPFGIGCLIGKKELLESLPPFISGGEMVAEVFWEKATWNELPWKFEAGTPAIADAIGWKAAVDYLERIGMESVHSFEKKIGKKAFEALSSVSGLELYGPVPSKKCALFSFNLKGVHPHDIATVLDSEGIAIRSGNHCAQPLLRDLGIQQAARASFYVYNTEEELEQLLHGIEKTKKVFGV
jgi:cysteine desulfurase/selenocysteine lyase